MHYSNFFYLFRGYRNCSYYVLDCIYFISLPPRLNLTYTSLYKSKMYKICCICHFYNIFGDTDVEEWISCSCGTSLLHATCKSAITTEYVFSCCGMVECPFIQPQEVSDSEVENLSVQEVKKYAAVFKMSFEKIIKRKENSIPNILNYDSKTLSTFFKILGCEDATKTIDIHDMTGEKFLLLTKDEIYKYFQVSKRLIGKINKHHRLLKWKLLSSPM